MKKRMKEAMDAKRFVEIMNSGERVEAGSETHQYMTKLSNEAMKITARLNRDYHEPEEIRAMMEELTGQKIDGAFGMFPPFYTDCGKNLHIGKHVFINSGCHFQDQGGIYIGDGALIGHCVVLATLNHEQDPGNRGDLYPKPHWEKCVDRRPCDGASGSDDRRRRDRGCRSGRHKGCPCRGSGRRCSGEDD